MSGAREVQLTPKALALLSFLAERPGEVITKEELFGAVWPETTVGDAALVTCIQELRKALRDDARHPRYIETLHRRGYRFIGKTAPIGRARCSSAEQRARSAAARPSFDRGVAVRQHERRSRAGLFRRRHFRGSDHRPVAHPLAVRHRAQLDASSTRTARST